ncbi:hypothetical protein [Nitrobacter sp.]|uniref:hypothetical protein n=1 Tax=Nitrobacter sp. TaxID=29420 RepID=UPI00092C0AE0|nr:hypothetical protein [Nitrobacter sp.]OJV00613.1 MAG: hypothetical protein BGO16_11100 [Nitrobacter sp. 62-23]
MPLPRSLFDHEIREEWFDDVVARCAFFFKSVHSDELIPAFEALPKLLNLMRVKTFLPLKIDQA